MLREVTGKALRLYWHVERSQGATLDELVMKKSFKKRSDLDPSLATLRRLGLVRRGEDGRYHVPPEIASQASFLFKAFRPIGKFAVPYSLLSALGFSAFFFGSLLFTEAGERGPVVLMGTVISVLFWVWAGYTWSKRPFK